MFVNILRMVGPAGLIAYLLAGLLMVVGAVELLRRLCFWLHNGSGLGPGSRRAGGTGAGDREGPGKLALVLIPTGAGECENLIRTGGQRVAWMALRPPCRLICLDDGSPETREIAARLALQYRGLELCGPEELAGLLTGKEEKDR